MLLEDFVLTVTSRGGYNAVMTPEEQANKIEEIYNEAMVKLEGLSKERNEIIKGYIKELESQKVNAIRDSLGLTNNN